MSDFWLHRFAYLDGVTLGALSAGGGGAAKPGAPRFLCYTLEDQWRDEKVMHETCIPEGRYQLTLRREGGFHRRYSERFPGVHRGMVWVRNVPGFEWILLHIGNRTTNTSGCILTGSTSDHRTPLVGASTDAYLDVYPVIADAIESGLTFLNVRGVAT